MSVSVDSTTVGTFLLYKIGKALERRKRATDITTNAVSIFTRLTRVLFHVSGFSLLTIAGFRYSMIIGFIVAGISCFVMSALMAPSTPSNVNNNDRR